MLRMSVLRLHQQHRRDHCYRERAQGASIFFHCTGRWVAGSEVRAWAIYFVDLVSKCTPEGVESKYQRGLSRRSAKPEAAVL